MSLRAIFEQKKNPAEPEADGQRLILDNLILSDEFQKQAAEIEDEIKPSPSVFDEERQPLHSSFESPSYENFYSRYLAQIRCLRLQWQAEIEELSITELFEIIKNRYLEHTPHELSPYGDYIKNEICKYAEAELRKRAKRNESKKTYYHVFGELICKSFNQNNAFPIINHWKNTELVDWIRERYAYLYANLVQDDFKTECRSALDMIDMAGTLDAKLKRSYPSLEKKSKNHTPQKTIQLEGKMISLLAEILDINFFSLSSFSDPSARNLSLEDRAKKSTKNIMPKISVKVIGKISPA